VWQRNRSFKKECEKKWRIIELDIIKPNEMRILRKKERHAVLNVVQYKHKTCSLE
jgi:hypothetical protein